AGTSGRYDRGGTPVSIVAAPDISAPAIEYSLFYPILIIFGAAFIGVLVEAFAPRRTKYAAQVVIALLAMAAALVGTILVARDLKEVDGDVAARGQVVADGAMAIDGPTIFIWCLILI